MIVALLNQMGGVGKTTLALHLAGEWARRGQHVTVIDADPQGSALDWSQQRARENLPRLFGVIGLARGTPHREAPELARNADHIVIDGPPRVAGLMHLALLVRPPRLGNRHGEPGGARDCRPCRRSREAGATTQSSSKRTFIARPADPERWIKTPEPRSSGNGDAAAFTARLTIDITPALRGRIKIAAFQRGLTVADLLRDLLAREFPPAEGDLP
jgi:hypothetical protein